MFSGFQLEDFEDGEFNIPGVSASAGAVLAPSGLTDSVDGDDGNIDGFGTLGHSWFASNGSLGITFSFSGLADLPTLAGIVWTDGSGTILFEAFDSEGNSLGQVVGQHADGSFGGTTEEDRFYGVQFAGGIGSIRISNSAGGLEVDHLQYAYIPSPSVVAFGIGGMLIASRRRR